MPGFKTAIILDGDFSSLSASTSARLGTFEGFTDVLNFDTLEVEPGSAVSIAATPASLSTTVMNVTASRESLDFTLPVGHYLLRQIVGIDIDHLAVGEEIHVHLPTTSNIGAVPEPSTFVLLGTGLVGTFFSRCRRKKPNRRP
ncbi:MAG: hypothetical protein A2107_05495 [Verrucomicrobia bacterium GWF2_62_7]|nr:MAG: hypothetical protein A2107_05495 [Verrucomicrobia bacterium GWF2_62_7]